MSTIPGRIFYVGMIVVKYPGWNGTQFPVGSSKRPSFPLLVIDRGTTFKKSWMYTTIRSRDPADFMTNEHTDLWNQSKPVGQNERSGRLNPIVR